MTHTAFRLRGQLLLVLVARNRRRSAVYTLLACSPARARRAAAGRARETERRMIHAPKGLASGYAGDLVPYRAAASTSAPEQDAEQDAEQGTEQGVPSLHELCSRVITDCYISPKTVCEVMDFAKAYHVPMLQRRVEGFVCHAWAGVRAANDPERLRQGEQALPPAHLRRARVWLVCRIAWAR